VRLRQHKVWACGRTCSLGEEALGFVAPQGQAAERAGIFALCFLCTQHALCGQDQAKHSRFCRLGHGVYLQGFSAMSEVGLCGDDSWSVRAAPGMPGVM